jgi:signal transduction histidine kinase
MTTERAGTESAGVTRSEVDRRWARSRFIDKLARTFAIIALAALVLINFLINRGIATARDQTIAMVEPARDIAYDLRFELANEVGLVRAGQQLTLAERARFSDAVGKEDQLLRALVGVAPALGDSVRLAVAELGASLDAWHAEAAAFMSGQRTRLNESGYQQALGSAARLNETLKAADQQRLYEIREMEELKLKLSIVAVLLAFIAAAVVAWLSRRLRLVAEEAWRRREEVERLMESKARLMRGITHDIKNPIGAIDGYAQLLEMGLKGALSQPQLESVTRIRRNVQSSLAIISDLLEMARVETGQLQLDSIETDVAVLTGEAVEDHRAELESRGLSVHYVAQLEQPLINTDPDRVRAILGNLLSNAAKYTPSGGVVTVTARRTTMGKPLQTLIGLSVHNTGPGIPADKQEKVFLEFERLEQGTKGGAGLGLAISRKVARLMGGDLTLESKPDEGATFTLWLRAAPAKQTTEPVKPADAGRILSPTA